MYVSSLPYIDSFEYIKCLAWNDRYFGCQLLFRRLARKYVAGRERVNHGYHKVGYCCMMWRLFLKVYKKKLMFFCQIYIFQTYQFSIRIRRLKVCRMKEFHSKTLMKRGPTYSQ